MKKTHAIAIFCLLGAVIIGLGAYAWSLDGRLERAGREGAAYSGGALGELTGALAAMDEALRESRYATSDALLSTLCAKAAANAAGAVTALASLPYPTQELEKLAQYVNGAGDYALYLSRRAAEGLPMGEEERGNLERLSQAVADISAETGGIAAALDAGELEMDAYAAASEDAEGTVGSSLAALDAALEAFPSLEYAGRYSAAEGGAAFLEGLDAAGEGEAALAAAELLGAEAGELRRAGLRDAGGYEVYVFEHGEGSGSRSAAVTRLGCLPVSLTGGCSGGKASTSREAALAAALELASGSLGCEFEAVSAEERANAYAFTLAPVTGSGVLLLPDSVFAVVDAATGEVCAYDAEEFILNHSERGELVPAIDASAASAALPQSLKPLSARLALDAVEGGVETLCWLFSCEDAGGGGVNVFVDAKNGVQTKIELTA